MVQMEAGLFHFDAVAHCKRRPCAGDQGR
jgi:hypothetical protein